MNIKKIANIQSELKQIQGVNWYTKYAITQELIKEAGWKENITSSILAALFMVLNGTTVEAASKRTNITKEQILAALQDSDTVNKAINLYKIPIKKKHMKNTKNPSTPNPVNRGMNIPTPAPSFDDVYNFISANEGVTNKVYKDPAGNLAIGIGFNLDRPFAKSVFKNAGIDYNAVRQGKKVLSSDEIKKLFTYDYNLALKNATIFVNNYNYLPYDVKLALIDMSFNMGLPRLSGFVKFKAALENYDFKIAASEMQNSKWYAEVKGRGSKLVAMVASAPDTGTQMAVL